METWGLIWQAKQWLLVTRAHSVSARASSFLRDHWGGVLFARGAPEGNGKDE